MCTNHGKKIWAFAAGHIPQHSRGKEPMFTSHDKIAVLNTSDMDADIELQIFYTGKGPVGKYHIRVKARRLRKIRFNDLIDPFPLPLDTPYGFIVTSNEKVIVQFSRMNTAPGPQAISGSNAYRIR